MPQCKDGYVILRMAGLADERPAVQASLNLGSTGGKLLNIEDLGAYDTL